MLSSKPIVLRVRLKMHAVRHKRPAMKQLPPIMLRLGLEMLRVLLVSLLTRRPEWRIRRWRPRKKPALRFNRQPMPWREPLLLLVKRGLRRRLRPHEHQMLPEMLATHGLHVSPQNKPIAQPRQLRSPSRPTSTPIQLRVMPVTQVPQPLPRQVTPKPPLRQRRKLPVRQE